MPNSSSPYLQFIDEYWDKVTQYKPHDVDRVIGLPNPYISPNNDKYTDLYYWDSYFHILGLLACGRTELAQNIVDNFLFLLEKFGLIPNANCFFFLSRSQPPLLSSMILLVYQHNQDKKWLSDAFEKVKKEYTEVWLGSDWKNRRLACMGLSRYYDINDLHFLAELESGWDLTSRFMGRCMDILPVDLNTMLYKYERDFAEMAKILGTDEQQHWQETAENRQKHMSDIMWNQETGLFHDYDCSKSEQSPMISLATFFPLYFKMATPEQAKSVAQNLKRFEHDGGLATTDHLVKLPKDSYSSRSHVQQWDYPNGWAPLHLVAIIGLRNYDLTEDAQRIAKKWMKTCEINFDRDGFFMEKYNVVNPLEPAKGHYGVQEGFGWTNAVYKVLSDLYGSPAGSK